MTRARVMALNEQGGRQIKRSASEALWLEAAARPEAAAPGPSCEPA